MEPADDFEQRYRREYDFYDQASRLAAQIIDQNLRRAGIRAIVTSRAKLAARALEKVRQRAPKRNYVSVDDIYIATSSISQVSGLLYTFPVSANPSAKYYGYVFFRPRIFPGSSAISWLLGDSLSHPHSEKAAE